MSGPKYDYQVNGWPAAVFLALVTLGLIDVIERMIEAVL